MIILIFLVLFFAATVGGAGALLGLSCRYVSGSRPLGVAAICFGAIVGFGSGFYFGFDGFGGGAATGLNWYGQPIMAMPLAGLGVLVAAVFCLSFAMRFTAARDKSD
jgi:hypothetical protein